MSSFQRDRKPLQSRKDELLARSEFVIREHQRAGLTTNARVCLHAETSLYWLVFYIRIIAVSSASLALFTVR
ncbi:hypothetical protein BACI9J_130556 [Bacillus altitudinis]|nr:hypothetical protein BACI9J_130556 [Bacillus altitudinis]